MMLRIRFVPLLDLEDRIKSRRLIIKRRHLLMMASILVSALLFTVPGNALGANREYTDDDVKNLMSSFKHSDGAGSETIICNLTFAFMDNPEQIIRLLSEVEPDDREELIFYITAYPYTGDEEEIERFEQAMYGLKETLADQKYLDTLNMFIEAYEAYGGKDSESSSNMTLYIIIGVVVVAVISLIIYLFLKKRN